MSPSASGPQGGVEIEVVQADLGRPEHQRAVVSLTEAYALDPMGGGVALPDTTRRELIAGLKDHPTTLVLLAFAGDEPIGIATCFVGFSTFAARRLLNLHDLTVLPAHRGQGVGRLLLEAVERRARELGCCKLTLEVADRNDVARRVYERAGFVRPTYGEAGALLVYAKALESS